MATIETVDAQYKPDTGGEGPPKWLLVGGAVAVGLGLMVFLSKRSGAGTSAGTPTQTQESLAVGDLAYQVQSGLGALSVQAAKNQAENVGLTNQLIGSQGTILDYSKGLWTKAGEQQTALSALQNSVDQNYQGTYATFHSLQDFLYSIWGVLGRLPGEPPNIGKVA